MATNWWARSSQWWLLGNTGKGVACIPELCKNVYLKSRKNGMGDLKQLIDLRQQ